MSDPKDSDFSATDVPQRLVSDDVNQPSAEGVREMKANLTGFFTVLREWAATEKARPPPR